MKIKSLFIVSLLIPFGGLYTRDLADLFPTAKIGGYHLRLDMDVLLPESPTCWEILGSAEAVNRLGREVMQSPGHWFINRMPGSSGTVILIRESIRRNDPVNEHVHRIVSALSDTQALVLTYSWKKEDVLLIYGKGKGLRQASLHFFARYPFLGELKGEGLSPTFKRVKEELSAFCRFPCRVQGIVYEIPDEKKWKQAELDRFRFPPLLISRILTAIEGGDGEAQQRIQSLISDRKRGERSEVLSFTDAAAVEIGMKGKQWILPRSGFPSRELTPVFKPFRKIKIKPYTVSMEKLVSPAGLLQDINGDGIADTLKSAVVLNEKDACVELIDLCGRFSSILSGTSFPFFVLESEIDEFSGFDFPLLYGTGNRFSRDLLEKGKITASDSQQSQILIINNSTGPSPLLWITDRAALSYFNTSFPQFLEFDWNRPTLKHSLDSVLRYLSPQGGGDLLYFSNRIQAKDGLHAKGTVSDRFPLEFSRRMLADGSESVTLWNDTRTVKEWKIPIAPEGQRVWDELKKTLAGDSAKEVIKSIELRLSESPEVRRSLERELEEKVKKLPIGATPVKINSAYKFAYFYILERFLPRIKNSGADRVEIYAPPLEQDRIRPRRFYADGLRWLQELYPVDDHLAKALNLPLTQVHISIDPDLKNRYRFRAFSGGKEVAADETMIFPYQRPYLDSLPSWGDVEVAGGGILLHRETGEPQHIPFETDLEVFWNRYQAEVLPFLLDHVNKKTAHAPKLDNQPFFKQLKIDIRLSEPDFRTGFDQEMISSLEAIHDEVYFDTLDFLSGLLRIEPGDKEFNMRKSSPGNILPLIHPSSEGEEGEVIITLTDTAAAKPRLQLYQGEREEKIEFPRLDSLTPVCTAIRLEGNAGTPQAMIEITCEKENEFPAVNAVYGSLQDWIQKKEIEHNDPMVKYFDIRTRFKEDRRRFLIQATDTPQASPPAATDSVPIPARILPPGEVSSISARLAGLPGVKVFLGGESFEKRELPVLFAADPKLTAPSLPKLLVARPTLFFSARQHANEVSSTTYVLQLFRDLAANPSQDRYLKKLNLLVLPVENPDGAELTYEMQKETPYHSLHAGRYTAKGVDVGYVQDEEKPPVPEAKVRPLLNRIFLPDLHLNLHGYPSHEWVQPFSGYTPFLFRNYWIPKGMFLYYNYLNRAEAAVFKKTGEALLEYLARGLADLPGNSRLVDRYRRWSQRWAPHLNYLDMVEGSLIYHRRENAGFKKVPHPALLLAGETPELMDETAQGPWLEQVLEQGRTYLKLHLDFFLGLEYEYAADHYEADERVYMLNMRLRPGKIASSEN